MKTETTSKKFTAYFQVSVKIMFEEAPNKTAIKSALKQARQCLHVGSGFSGSSPVITSTSSRLVGVKCHAR